MTYLLGQIFFYKLIYEENFQHVISNTNGENMNIYEKILPNYFLGFSNTRMKIET